MIYEENSILWEKYYLFLFIKFNFLKFISFLFDFYYFIEKFKFIINILEVKLF